MMPTEPAATPTSWGPRPVLLVIAGVVSLLGCGASLLVESSADRFYAVVVTLLAALSLLAGLMMRRRLEVGPQGLRVGTLTGARIVRWSQVTAIRVVTRTHLGIGSPALHLDLGDDGLFIFGRLDLGTDPEDVAAALENHRPHW